MIVPVGFHGVHQGGGGFSPAGVAGLSLWLKADAGLYDAAVGGNPVTTNGANVLRWEDQSGNGTHMTAAAGPPSYPTLAINAVNGFPALSFVRANEQRLGRSSSSPPTVPFSAFAAFRSSATSNQNVLAVTNGTTGSASWGLFRANSAAIGLYTSTSGNLLSTLVYTNGIWTVVSAVAAASNNRKVWANGANHAAQSTSASAPAGLSQWTVGSWVSGADGLDGHIGELVVYSGGLSDANRQAVENYLISKYAIS